MIKLQTKGKGVDYVLNSLADDKLMASIRCLGTGGVFLEIGKVDMANNTKLGMGHFMNELSFHAILVDLLLVGDSPIKTVSTFIHSIFGMILIPIFYSKLVT